MDTQKRSRTRTEDAQKDSSGQGTPGCALAAAAGIPNSAVLKQVLAAAISDVSQKRLSDSGGNAIANLSGKLLKTAELEMKFAQRNNGIPTIPFGTMPALPRA